MLSLDLQKQIQLYLDEEISLSELEEWIVPRIHRFLADPNSKDANVVAIIEQGLVETRESLIDENSLRNLLSNAINQMNVSFSLEQSVIDGTASETFKDLITRSFHLEPSGT